MARHLLLDIYVSMPGVSRDVEEVFEAGSAMSDVTGGRSQHTVQSQVQTECGNIDGCKLVIVEMRQRGSFQLDVLTHRLINALNNPAAGKKYECRMYDANIACRKLAVQHPTLMRRYDVGLSRKLKES